MRKISKEQDNPIDNIMYDISEYLSPYFKNLNMSPNNITSLSFGFGLLGCNYLNKREINKFTICHCLSHLFDCMDGFYARKYKMITKYGDIYDHITDYIIFSTITYILYKKYNLFNHKKLLILILALIILLVIETGCQELIYQKKKGNIFESETLGLTKQFCKNKPEEKIKFLRYFGVGTTQFILILIVYYLNSK